MATRGYQSYRGRNHGKLALVIVLVLILLAAVGYLVAQEIWSTMTRATGIWSCPS